jgi:hypothetical protein
MATVDSYFLGVTPIFPLIKSDNIHTSKLGCATGFFFKSEDSSYLITNRHVIIDEEDSFFPNKIRIIIHDNIELLSIIRSYILICYKSRKKCLISQVPGILYSP